MCQLQTEPCRWHPPSASIWIKACAAAAADLQHLLTELREECRQEALGAQAKAGWTGLQRDVFRSWFYEPTSCMSSYLEAP